MAAPESGYIAPWYTRLARFVGQLALPGAGGFAVGRIERDMGKEAAQTARLGTAAVSTVATLATRPDSTAGALARALMSGSAWSAGEAAGSAEAGEAAVPDHSAAEAVATDDAAGTIFDFGPEALDAAAGESAEEAAEEQPEEQPAEAAAVVPLHTETR